MNDTDDSTRGFSFSGTAQPSAVQAADVVLHLPQQFPIEYFATYQGRWIRCVYALPENSNIGNRQSGYSSSPQIMKLAVRSIGGTVSASQCRLIRDELTGESDGTPGQNFSIQGVPILPRQEGEHLLVVPSHGLPQIWQEVNDFADSTVEDRHYTIDSQTGLLQFGPLIREPAQLKENVQLRARVQLGGESAIALMDNSMTERQYGAVPPRGAMLRMVAYRTGGGQKGNVQRHTLRTLKSAVPYVARATNHAAARNGADAESLDDAVIRVPRMLRTRDRAVTPEDFEALTLQGARGAIARVLCPSQQSKEHPGRVELLIVPQANREGVERGEGIDPAQLMILPQLKEQVLEYLDERRLLGIQVQLSEPEYVGVAVQTEVGLEPEYNHPQAQQEILRSLRVALYRFLNPLTGGAQGTGWSFGSPVYPSDIITLIQRTTGVRYLGTVLLFELRRQENGWVRSLSTEGIVNPGANGLICSWADAQLRSGHAISLIS